MLPFIANEIAFMNSVVFGTRANSVTPKNFSSIPEPSKTTSTTSTKISVFAKIICQSASNETQTRETANSPAMIAYSAVHANNTLALVVRLHDGASCPPCPASISPPNVRSRAG